MATTYHYNVSWGGWAYSEEKWWALQKWARTTCKDFWTNMMGGGNSHGKFSFTCTPGQLKTGLNAVGIEAASSSGIEIAVNREGLPVEEWG